MKNTVVVAVIAVIARMSFCDVPNDDDIKRMLAYGAGVFDNPSFAESFFTSSIEMCGYDTNRYVCLMADIASSDLTNTLSKTKRLCECMLRRIGEFGTTNSLPFLYECATNPIVGDVAVASVVKIGGANSNSVECLRQYLALTNTTILTRVGCCERISNLPAVATASELEKTSLSACLVDFAHGANVWTKTMDESIIRIDQTYRYSRRRLGVMRSLQSLELNAYVSNYVATVISELVAYPESALGD